MFQWLDNYAWWLVWIGLRDSISQWEKWHSIFFTQDKEIYFIAKILANFITRRIVQYTLHSGTTPNSTMSCTWRYNFYSYFLLRNIVACSLCHNVKLERSNSLLTTFFTLSLYCSSVSMTLESVEISIMVDSWNWFTLRPNPFSWLIYKSHAHTLIQHHKFEALFLVMSSFK